MQVKTCNKCKIEKTINDFHRNRRMKDGHDVWCKDCRNAASRDYSRRNPNYQHEYYMSITKPGRQLMQQARRAEKEARKQAQKDAGSK